MARTPQEIENEQLERFNRETNQLALTRKRALLNAAADDNVDSSREAIIDEHVKKRIELAAEIKEMLKSMQRVNGYDQFVSSMMEIIELCKKNAEYLHTYDPLHNVVLLAVDPFRWDEVGSALIPSEIKNAYTEYRNNQLPANVAFDVQQTAFDRTQVNAEGDVSFVTTDELLEEQLLPGTETIPQGAKSQVVEYARKSIIAMQMGYFASQGYDVAINPDNPTACRVTQAGVPMTQAQLTACKASFSDYIRDKRLSMNIKQEPVTPELGERPRLPGR